MYVYSVYLYKYCLAGSVCHPSHQRSLYNGLVSRVAALGGPVDLLEEGLSGTPLGYCSSRGLWTQIALSLCFLAEMQ
jgi:hypothetical protein